MQQNKVTILCTRAIDEAWISEAASKNILVDTIPFIRVETIRSKQLQQEIKEALALTSTVIFTSVNAVEAVTSELENQKPNWKIFCIDKATRILIEKYFGKSSIMGSAINAKELADEILQKDIKEVIFFCGDQRRDDLPAVLQKNNVIVHEKLVYQTIASSQKIEKRYDGILFFSPSAVQSFFQVNKPGRRTVLFAIGNTTANEIKKCAKNKILISDEPTKKALLETALTYFQTHPIHN